MPPRAALILPCVGLLRVQRDDRPDIPAAADGLRPATRARLADGRRSAPAAVPATRIRLATSPRTSTPPLQADPR